MDNWICAKTRLPEVNEAGISKDVLVLYSDIRRGHTEICVGFYRATVGWNFRIGRAVSNLGKKIKITHWMPLPDIPEEMAGCAPRFTKVQETEPQDEPQTFTERLKDEIYKAVMDKLDVANLCELANYETDFDYGDPAHAETAEQYDECVDKIMDGAVRYVLDMYVIHTEDELAEKNQDLPIWSGRFGEIAGATEVTAICVEYTVRGMALFDEPERRKRVYFTKDGIKIGELSDELMVKG